MSEMKNVWKSGAKVLIGWLTGEGLVQFVYLLKDEQGVYLRPMHHNRVVFVPWTALAEIQWPEMPDEGV